MDLAFREFVGDNICAIDLTPMPGIDDLLQPTESIKEAQELAAEAWGADHTFFLINGSTSGNQCMMMTACNPGDKIAVPRNSHKSMLGGLVMSGARAGLHAAGGRRRAAHGPLRHAGDRRATLARASRLVAVYVVSPTYYGVAADLASIERIVHGAGKLLLVDEAWGPHFHFHPALPLSATAAGADLCINSTHKMLSAFSQCAMLHQKGDRVRLDRLKAVLKMFLSTSPNLPMVASLDVARRQMATEGAALLSRTIALANETRARLNEIDGIYCFGEEMRGRNGVFDLDPTKIAVTVKGLGYTGYEARRFCATATTSRSSWPISSTSSRCSRSARRAKRRTGSSRRSKRWRATTGRSTCSRRRAFSSSASSAELISLPEIPPMRMLPRDAFLADDRVREVQGVAGRICAETLTPYPPGIPVIAPGEEITPTRSSTTCGSN